MALANNISVLREAVLRSVEPSRCVANNIKCAPPQSMRTFFEATLKKLFSRLSIRNSLYPRSRCRQVEIGMIRDEMRSFLKEAIRERFEWVKSERSFREHSRRKQKQQSWVFRVEQQFRKVLILPPSEVTHSNLSPR